MFAFPISSSSPGSAFLLTECKSGMPRKIGFTVISWSGHEENYSAKELMVHAPTVNGWRSAR